jgi:hypothetical protein
MYSRTGLRSISLKCCPRRRGQGFRGLVGTHPARLAPGVGNGQIGARLGYGNPTKEKGCCFFSNSRGCGNAPIRYRLSVNAGSENAC